MLYGDEFVETIRAMDLLTVSTPHLSKRMEEYVGYRPPVLPNHIDVGWFKEMSYSADRQFEGLTVGFLGTSSHYGDWEYPIEALKRLKEEHEITVTVGGYFPDYLEGIAEKISGVPYRYYPMLMRQFDIVLCALDPEDMFNKSKSAVKALEAMASARDINGKVGGAIPVCTDMPVYRRCVRHGVNGMLVSDDDWYTPIKDLITDERKRKRLAIQGHRWVTKNRDVKKGHVRWSRVYRDLMRRKND
jgi:glycosyltransferase involved in cell wall biosynthesis